MTSKRSIIVTGGASGIGLGITRHFITDPDNHVTILDVNPTTGAQTLDQFRTEFPSASVSFEQCDVSSWESQAEVFERVYVQQSRIDIVFANAGITEKRKSFAWKRRHQWTDKAEFSNRESVQLAIHYMAKNEFVGSSKGSIVCTASNAGLYPFPMAPIYSATKHGVIGLVRSLARPLEAENIRINALAPAVIATNIAPSADLFKSMVLTPMSTATKAVAQLVDDETLTGRVAELHGEHVTLAEAPAYVDEDTGRNIETFWELGYA
ncbi:uncharacterized protein N7477_005943 [Penicillium maclennaniae]|uniref:uncharacterized protein n=1 Tax=Penicillium maclennaniae TaxID=1343394 RepID=UPI00253FEF15|nr:uncharacterized protein N7477_005943 [Penicillium maclennaniae]KAJ5670580.1 hypothetical protein N7477_005943 [Penicillium maclennaniae]